MKINVGQNTGKKYRHNLQHSVTTTSQFGFCQPTLVREVNAQDTISLRVASSILLQPIVKPTFGRLFLKQYNMFVPTEEIWHAYPSFLAAKSYHGSGSRYIPQQAPALPLWFLTWCVHMHSTIWFYTGSFSSSSNGVTWSTAPAGQTSITDANDALSKWLLDVAALDPTMGANYYQWFLDVKDQFFQVGHVNLPTGWTSSDYTIEMADWYYTFTTTSNVKYLVCGRFTDRGKNLRKILLGAGFQLIYSKNLVNIMPLWAYYKTWFDLFAIQRVTTWKDTPLFHIMEKFEQLGGDFWSFSYQNLTKYDIADLFTELSECYYTQNPDYASAHISGTGVGPSLGNVSFLRPAGQSGSPAPATGQVLDYVYGNANTNVQPLAGNAQNQTALDVLRKLYQRVNINTVVGGRIRDYMRAVFGSDYKQENESNFLGSSSYPIDITKVMSNAVTAQGYLGEYAGKGEGSSAGETLKFTARRAGYLVSMFCLVPDARLAQAVDPLLNHVSRFDFFDPSFDSITLLPTKKMNVYGAFDINSPIATLDQTAFGNIPNYMEYKIAFDKVNGDISMASTRGSYLPFTMAKLLPFSVVDGSSNGHIRTVQPSAIVESSMWRYIGKQRWLGNFDRIFVNDPGQQGPQQGGNVGDLDQIARLDDNFVCYFYNDLQITGYELAVADSFQTDPFGDHITVDKA